MKRILVGKPGGHDVLALVEEPDPRPGEGQALVKVRAAGVNYADCMVRMGYYAAAKGLYPITPGFEFAGTVESTGEGVADFAPGDRVFGITRFGGYADRIVADARLLWRCPEEWDFADCAGFPAVFLTAYYGLFRAARVEKGEKLLIHSAAGGAGAAFVQLANIKGCPTVGVVGAAHKAVYARDLGCGTVITRAEENLWKAARRAAPDGFAAIFDANGVSTLRRGYEHLAPGGRLVAYGFAEIMPRGKDVPGRLALAWNYLRVPSFSPLDMTMKNRAVVGFNVVYLFADGALVRRAMAELLGWVAAGKIRKAPVTCFPLQRAAEAHAALESGTTQGKLVLTA
ncbi:MAG: zinc-binding dehydrogenase [Elusimicrobiota bacterium]